MPKKNSEDAFPPPDQNLPDQEKGIREAAKQEFLQNLRTALDFLRESSRPEFTPAVLEVPFEALKKSADKLMVYYSLHNRSQVLNEIIKRYARSNKTRPKDLQQLYSLLEIREEEI